QQLPLPNSLTKVVAIFHPLDEQFSSSDSLADILQAEELRSPRFDGANDGLLEAVDEKVRGYYETQFHQLDGMGQMSRAGRPIEQHGHLAGQMQRQKCDVSGRRGRYEQADMRPRQAGKAPGQGHGAGQEAPVG